ncbi:hypothetical protein ECNE1487_2103, partial [Escherichia coli NE1487]
VTCR